VARVDDAGPGRLRHAVVATALGPVTIVADERGAVAGLYWPDHRPPPPPRALGVGGSAAEPLLAPLAAAVLAYLEGTAASVEVPLADVGGTPFQRAVWAEVAAIPPGTTRTYAEVAAAVGRPGGRRAVGAALAADPRCLAVPCHRVVGERGAVTGYSGGVERKRWLLHLEAHGAPPVPITAPHVGPVTGPG
jgi:methylated-DNA-[protein]-cysteine S-methyltransferase